MVRSRTHQTNLVVALAWATLLFLAGCARPQAPDPNADEPMVDPIPADEIPPSPVLSAQQALADFEVEPGFRVELVAAEPDVVAPVAMTFDGDGAIWVVEMRGYMPDVGATGEDQPVGTVRVLRDLDSDGSFETTSTFLDGLVMPRALAIVDGGILLAEPPNLWYVENDNYLAGQRMLVDSAYAVGGNVEHQPNGLLQAIDNWIYSAKSDVRYRFSDGSWVTEQTEYRGQWGISQDDYGRLFYNHNSATLQGDNVPPNTFPSNPNHEATHTNIGASKASNRVYPRRINPGVNRAYRKATLGDDGKLFTVTGTCGPVIYRGASFPDSHYGNAFVMEPTGNVVMRVVLHDDEGVVSGQEPYVGREFLSATDERFRPVNGYTGPDGALYIVDMYRGVIQHKTYLTEYLQRQIKQRDLETPIDRGRIYRVVADGAGDTDPPTMIGASTRELIRNLGHANGWWRDTAQRLIVQSQDKSAAGDLRELVAARTRGPQADLTRIHALWTLEGLGVLRVSDLRTATTSSSDPKVHATALRLAGILGQASETSPDQRSALLSFVVEMNANDREVTLQRTLALHNFRESHPDRVEETLLAIATKHRGNPEFVDAIVGGLQGAEDAFQVRAEPSRSDIGDLYAAVEQARFTAQLAPVQASLQLGEDHRETYARGRQLYATHCAACHGNNGKGLPAQAPTLIRSQWVLQDAETAIRIVLDGLSGPIAVNGRVVQPPEVQDVMPGFRGNALMSDEDVAALLTFVRNMGANRASIVSPSNVTSVRKASRGGSPYAAEELEALRAEGWDELMPDAAMSEWEIKGGAATYDIVDGQLVGTTVPNSPNTFLTTKRNYADFILEFEVLVDSLINSGVQIRSESKPDYQNGRVHGYQIEIDPSDRAWSAGIYDEARRGWLFDLRGNPAARAAFRRDGWNHYRVEARGPHLRTWLNGVLAADLMDDMTATGFIGFQVHGVGSDHLVGRTIRWRNIRIKEH